MNLTRVIRPKQYGYTNGYGGIRLLRCEYSAPTAVRVPGLCVSRISSILTYSYSTYSVYLSCKSENFYINIYKGQWRGSSFPDWKLGKPMISTCLSTRGYVAVA